MVVGGPAVVSLLLYGPWPGAVGFLRRYVERKHLSDQQEIKSISRQQFVQKWVWFSGSREPAGNDRCGTGTVFGLENTGISKSVMKRRVMEVSGPWALQTV